MHYYQPFAYLLFYTHKIHECILSALMVRVTLLSGH